MDLDPPDIPSPIDFHNPAEARRWIVTTLENRPYRAEFFEAIVTELKRRSDEPMAILDLGSGPGFLAERVLRECNVGSYTLLDFSSPMLEMARQRLTPFLEAVHLVQRDFRLHSWTDGLGQFDAILSLQSIHEIRHKRRVHALYEQIKDVMRDGGIFLVCDHVYDEVTEKRDPELFMTRNEQLDALKKAGFEDIKMILGAHEMTLHSGLRRDTNARSIAPKRKTRRA